MRLTDEELQEIAQEHINGKTLLQIGKERQRNPDNLSRRLRQMGVSITNHYRISKEIKKQIVSRYQQGESSSALAVFFKISQTGVLRILEEYSVPSRNVKERGKLKSLNYITDFKERISSLYIEGFSINYIANELQIQPTAIKRFLHENQITRNYKLPYNRKYAVNDNFFDELNREDNCYCLGMWYADGWVSKDKNIVSISLQEKDADILRKIRDLIQPNKPLYFRFLGGKIQNQYKLEIHSKQIRDALIKWGCVPNKTHLLTFPSFLKTDKEIQDFIRGHFDGDGALNKNNIHIVGTPAYIYGLKAYIENKLKIYCSIGKISGTDVTISLRINGKTQTKYFLWWLYKDATIYMERKYNKYQEMLKEIFKHPKRLAFENNKLQKMIDDFLNREQLKS